jgi:hypothetical protein
MHLRNSPDFYMYDSSIAYSCHKGKALQQLMMYAIILCGFMHTNLIIRMFDEGLNAFNTTLDHFGKKRSNESLEVMLMNQHYRKESLRERSYSMHPCTSLTCDIGNT